MTRRGLWAALALVPLLLGMAAVSVLAVPTDRSVERYPVTIEASAAITVHRLAYEMNVPASDRWRPSAVIITNDGKQIRAFSNRSHPFGCSVVERAWNRLGEPCHGTIWDLSGTVVAGPPRYLYAYPVRAMAEGRVEVDLARPSVVMPGP